MSYKPLGSSLLLESVGGVSGLGIGSYGSTLDVEGCFCFFVADGSGFGFALRFAVVVSRCLFRT